jgi:predicted small lipoprotein YifL
MQLPLDGLVRSHGVGLRGIVIATLACLTACSNGGDVSLPTADTAGPPGSVASFAAVTGYGASNAFFTTGYSDREIEPDHHIVRAKGSSVTPVGRIEKIALARAAELGVELGRPYFKAGPPTQSVVCKAGKDAIHKSGKVPAERNALVEIDVLYAKRPPDASYQVAADVHARLIAELASEGVSAESKAAAVSALADQCGK